MGGQKEFVSAPDLAGRSVRMASSLGMLFQLSRRGHQRGFATGTTELLSVTECPHSQFRTLPPINIICGDFVLVQMYRQSLLADIYAIINWRAQKYCKIPYPLPNVYPPCAGWDCLHVQFFSRDRIFVWNSSQGTSSSPGLRAARRKRSGSSPSPLSPLRNEHRWHNETSWDNDGSSPKSAPTQHLSSMALRPVFRHSRARHCHSRALFRLSLPGADNRKPTLQQRACALTASDAANAGIAYSGHSKARLGDAGTHRIVPLDRVHSAPTTLQIPEASWSVALVPYSRAVGYVTAQTFVLSYFE
ncbi:hypothetical protein C8R44DRAFT_730364 [Mycena epipterygia]|nr:hypothetical protein C8R44DRAFT_730364 [Mycena epipterygia]